MYTHHIVSYITLCYIIKTVSKIFVYANTLIIVNWKNIFCGIQFIAALWKYISITESLKKLLLEYIPKQLKKIVAEKCTFIQLIENKIIKNKFKL